MTWLDMKREELLKDIFKSDIQMWDLYNFLKIIDEKERIIKSMQFYELQLERNCKRWEEINQGLITAGDAMVVTEKNGKKQQDWFDAKSRYVVIPSK